MDYEFHRLYLSAFMYVNYTITWWKKCEFHRVPLDYNNNDSNDITILIRDSQLIIV